MSKDILDTLDRIHAALLDGRFGELTALTDEVEATLASGAMPERGFAESLRKKCERNQECLAGAMAGVRLAQCRLREIARAAQGMAIYDQRGARVLLGGQSQSGRRA